ncbi:MAG: IS30 family transposase [Erysipelotrichia bacterium]|nr:IS30 family transposase [Erysipelotrichia bacterium]NCC82432.1 IS30 family transposase [Clostridia bacterium]
MSNGSQLTFKEREHLEFLLNEGKSLSVIALELNRDPRGIKYEIIHHRELFVRKNQRNKCGIQITCKKKRLCNHCDSGLCKHCGHIHCDTFCSDFCETPNCKTINRFPCVCNGCKQIKDCPLPKFYYKAQNAHIEYKNNITEHKKGPQLNGMELKELDKIVSDGVKNGLSIEVIIQTNHLDIATSTIYRYIDENLLSVKNIDLKRKVRYKARITNKPKAVPIEYDYLKDRTYNDFTQYFLDNPSANIWQMDTVEGRKGGSAVLTLLFIKTNLQLYFKIPNIERAEILNVFIAIRKHLGNDLFKETFQCILTDNGKEYKDPLSIEIDSETGEVLTKVFYCEPRRSDQKGKCEKNHEHFREMIPKGKSMDGYGQKTIDHVSNQVNNYPRKSLNYHSPLESSLQLLNKKVFELNNLQTLSPEQITLKHLVK